MKRVLIWGALTLTSAIGVAVWIVRGERVVEPTHLPVDPATPPPTPGADAFPWEGTTTLTSPDGQTLTWTVEREDGEVRIKGVHPKWHVEHRAKPDGTPLSTVKQLNGNTIRVTYSGDGASVERTDATGKTSHITLKVEGLWDADTLAVRLAGLRWTAGKKVRMKILDVDLADGTVYPMVAEDLGEGCVHLEVDDFRRLLAPSFEHCYAPGVGAKYLRARSGGDTFSAR
jgi:YD repeat-containing protein